MGGRGCCREGGRPIQVLLFGTSWNFFLMFSICSCSTPQTRNPQICSWSASWAKMFTYHLWFTSHQVQMQTMAFALHLALEGVRENDRFLG